MTSDEAAADCARKLARPLKALRIHAMGLAHLLRTGQTRVGRADAIYLAESLQEMVSTLIAATRTPPPGAVR